MPKDGSQKVVNLRGGTYSLNNTFALDSEDSGDFSSPVVYTAYNNEKVNIIGGVQIPLSDFSSASNDSRIRSDVKNNIVKVELGNYGIKSLPSMQPYGYAPEFWNAKKDLLGYTGIKEAELFSDDASLVNARYPNEDYSMITSVATAPLLQNTTAQSYNELYGATIGVENGVKSRMSAWENADDPWVFGHWQYSWLASASPVKSVNSADGKLQLKYPSTSTHFADRGMYYIYNLLEELDVPGEYYIDRKNNAVYLYPAQGMQSVTLSLLDKPLISVKDASNIIFKDLNIEASRADGFSVIKSDNININSSKMSNLGGRGISSVDSLQCRYSNNMIFNTAAGGISLDANTFADLKPTQCTVDNNLIVNFMRNGGTCAAISMGGIGDVASHNEIKGSESGAISLSGADCVIEYNDISEVLSKSADLGAIYAYRAMHKRGNVIKNNYFHDCTSTTPLTHKSISLIGVYLDENSSGAEISQNLFVNFDGSAVFINAGRDNTVKCNIAYNTPKFCQITDNTANYSIAEFKAEHYELEAFCSNSSYSKYPHFSNILSDNPTRPKYNVVDDNVISTGTEDFTWVNANQPDIALLQSYNSISPSMSSENIGFKNISNKDFSLNANSEIYSRMPEFTAPDFSNMGRR